MGFSTLIDVLGSTLVGGMLLLILFRINDATVENNYMYGGELIIQENLVEIVELIEHDFRKIGFCENYVALPKEQFILHADSNSIKFSTDIDSDGIVDSIHYYIGPTSELKGTPNPRDRFLYRVVNDKPPVGTNLGLTEFKLAYYNTLGHKLSFPINYLTEIQSIEINIKIEDVYGYDTKNDEKQNTDKYASAFWKQIKLSSRNITKK
ncbi:MAG: hypothetical protein CR986_07935 [Ignavibacteriae bacterium]|nr:MAG: hypothetical protein CR986_07935 [Ignavibacteriota bacterium]